MSGGAERAPDYAGHSAAHTPGPWVLDPCWDILGNTDDGNGMVCQITTDAVPRAEAEANARLIAAAPCLLEALNLVAWSGKFECFDDDAWELVNAAIDRATGAA